MIFSGHGWAGAAYCAIHGSLKNGNEIMPLDKVKYRGHTFVFDDDQMVSLTGLWKQMGALTKKKPTLWLKTDLAKELILRLHEKTNGTLLKIGNGQQGDMFVHWKIALVYSAFLSPKIKSAFMNVVRQRFTLDADAEGMIDVFFEEMKI